MLALKVGLWSTERITYIQRLVGSLGYTCGSLQLLNKSYTKYRTNIPDDEQLDFEEWCEYMAMTHSQFDY